MADSKTFYRVFLGSPGDLPDERELARVVVDGINRDLGDEFNCHVHLDRWEETPAADTRAQSFINQFVERCDIFVGMLYRRWGTPTGPDFSSGFLEEYELCESRKSSTGRPEIIILFKKISDQYTVDNPNQDLKSVLAFQSRLVTENKLKFDSFGTSGEYQEKLRSSLIFAIRKLRGRNAVTVQETAPTDAGDGRSTQAPEVNPLSDEGVAFLERFTGAVTKRHMAAEEIARFRLLGTAVYNSENDRSSLATHDANLLFARVAASEFGPAEVTALLNSGLDHFKSESVPVWRWCKRTGSTSLVVASFVGPQPRRAAALEVMRLLAMPHRTGPFEEGGVADFWFTPDAANNVRTAALNYLADCGTEADLPQIEAEFRLGASDTSTAAAEAAVAIKLRDSAESAFEILWRLSPPTLSDRLAAAMFDRVETVRTELLLPGLEQPNAKLRRKILRALSDRGEVPESRLRELLSDDDEWVRYEALSALYKGERAPSDLDIRAILVKPLAALSLNFLARAMTSSEAYDQFSRDQLSTLDNASLEVAVASSAGKVTTPYLVLMERQFSKQRLHLKAALKSALAEASAGTGVSDYFPGSSTPQAVARERARLLLSLLCQKGDKSDLQAVRAALDTDMMKYAAGDLEFLGKHGEWQDIRRVIDAAHRSVGSISLFDFDKTKYSAAAKAIYQLGRSRFAELITLLNDDAPVQAQLIVEAADNVFSKLPDDILLRLFNAADNTVRRNAALKTVKCLPRLKVRRILFEVLSKPAYYYNVCHWLDLGDSLARSESHHVASRALSASR